MGISEESIFNFVRDNSVREPLPGEVWRFGAFEAHVFYDILDTMVRDKLISGDNTTVKTFLETFRVVNDAYKLANSDLELPPGINVTPAGDDVGFFTSLIPFYQIFVKNEYLKTNRIKELEDLLEKAGKELGQTSSGCPCGNGDCEEDGRASEFLPCGHSLRMHLTILVGWYEREILLAERAVASRRAVGMVSPEKRHMGKQIVALFDMERMIEEHIARDFETGFYSPEMTEELIESIVESTGQSREEAEEIVAGMRKNAEQEARRQLWELAEENIRIIDTEKSNNSE
ncbi:MAG: hypothetical protein WDZ40_03660 [Candidatus Spechtbacterales bacterium]